MTNSANEAQSQAQCETVETLLAKERAIASQWWTILNEMRLHKQLPDWVLKMEGKVGSHAEMDAMNSIQDRTDIALSGKFPAWTYVVWDDKRNKLAGDFTSFTEAHEAAAALQEKHPTAGVARICATTKAEVVYG